jgi:hypothetical protein
MFRTGLASGSELISSDSDFAGNAGMMSRIGQGE